jgi:thiamine-phosphate pyrophosphorylase
MTRADARLIGLDVFYPIVPDYAWLKRIVPLGVRTIQLRIKDQSEARVRSEVAESLELCARFGCTLIVNDYWREAIESGATFVHLGQEDLAGADLAAIHGAGMRLGLSTHSREELATALAAEPDYIALGPIYETKLKAMKWKPQGLARIGEWRKSVSCPLVAIAGITLERAPQVIDAGADSVAVVTDFITHPLPEQRVREWLTWAATVR